MVVRKIKENEKLDRDKLKLFQSELATLISRGFLVSIETEESRIILNVVNISLDDYSLGLLADMEFKYNNKEFYKSYPILEEVREE